MRGFLAVLASLCALTAFAQEVTEALGQPEVLGHSSEGRPIHLYRSAVENPVALVVLGGIHGKQEAATVTLVESLQATWERPDNVATYLVPCLNPDSFFAVADKTRNSPTGYLAGKKVGGAWERFTSRHVDLNRNWPTADWKPDATYNAGDFRKAAGGAAPASEPELQAVLNLLLRLKAQHETVVVINLHSFVATETSVGIVQPAYSGSFSSPVVDGSSKEVATLIAKEANLRLLEFWTQYEISGEFLHWAGDNGLVAVDIELPTARDRMLELQDRFGTVLTLLAAYLAPT